MTDTAGTMPPMTLDRPVPPRPAGGFWSWYYRARFRRLGIPFGKGLKVMGPLLLRIDGDPANIVIGDYVTLMPWVDLKNRENGRIVLHDGVQLDTMVRLVAANDATIELGQEVKLGPWNIVNAGADVCMGRRTITAGHVYINSSEHLIEPGAPIVSQGYRHFPVTIMQDCWIGAFVTVAPGTRLGAGAVVGAHSRVRGQIDAAQVVAGNPAAPIKTR